MAVFLTILKVIGIVIASIIGLVLFVISLVLFVPIRYKVKANKENCDETVIEAHGTISWLLHILNIHIDYPSDDLIKIRVFFIRIGKKNKKDKKNKKTKDIKYDDEKIEESDNINISSTDISLVEEQDSIKDKIRSDSEKMDTDNAKEEQHIENHSAEDVSDEEVSGDDASSEKISEEEDSEEKPTMKGFIEKVIDAVKNIKLTVQNVYDKIKHICNNLNKYINIITSNTFSHAFKKCRVSLVKILKRILPRKLAGNIFFGTGDPSSTGKFIGYYSLIYPYISRELNVFPDFENKIAYGDVLIKGHFCVFSILRIMASAYFNKDVKKLLKMLKKEA